jgi:beta-glucanase (GH16 family)
MAEWKLDHEENFAQTRALDQDYWHTEIGFIRNREKQYYAVDNVKVTNGVLRIEARRERLFNAVHIPGSRAQSTSRRQAAYTSGAIVSRQEMLYGRLEVVARSPSGAGMWPAIWLLHESAGQYGEIDLFEAVGKHPDLAFATVHFGLNALSRRKRSANRHIAGFEKSWHVHSLEWTPERIVIAVDGEPLLSMDPEEARSSTNDPLRQPMRLRINLALGGNWGGPIDNAALPAHFDIASIKVWHWHLNSPADKVLGRVRKV